MKNLFGITTLVYLLFTLNGFGQTEDYSLKDKYEFLSDTIKTWVKNGKLVSAELLITENGEIVHHKAYGDAEVNSIWQIKSMTKPITATAALVLSEEGKLSLDDPIIKYIPEFAGDKRTTIQNLLNHTSGYDYMVTGWEKGDYDFKEWVTDIASKKPSKPFGKFFYSDFNIAALGYIVSLASGIDVEQFTQKRILKPLHMDNTYTWFTPDSIWAPKVNDRYRWQPETRTNEKYWTHKEEHQWPFYLAAGGIYSTAKDYAKFMQSWLDKGPLLSKETIEDQLLIPCKNGYGGGWALSGSVFYHGGYDGTYAFAFPDNKVVVLMAHSVGNTHKSEFQELLQRL